MAKVFRLHQGANGTGWFVSQSLTPAQLTTIKTEGKEVATSIPSPFARIDLVKSAFRWVTTQGIEGATAHHKLVSDALDVAQLFYLSRKYSSKIEIIAYNPVARFKSIIEKNGISRHNRFAETLKLYWEQDSVPAGDSGNLVLYNFEHVRRLYLIINKSTKQVIGGTSPATLFFAAPDAQMVASSLKIKSSDHELFCDGTTSLAHREPSFIRYMYALSRQPGFAVFFPEVFAYLEKVRLTHPDRELVSLITNSDEHTLQGYESCLVRNNANDHCEVLGIPLGVQKADDEEGGINESSDFTIISDFVLKGKKPLVLPHGRFAGRWTYTTPGIFWNENNSIPYKNEKSPADSKLPVQEDPYYWLSSGNFLEDKIIELPYSVDTSKFNLCGATRHLLPLTPTFLKYFKAANVGQMLKLNELAGGGVEAILEIPVKKGKIHFKKIYSLPDKEKPEAHLAIIPFLRAEKYNLDYTVGIIDDRSGNKEYAITCFEKGEMVKTSDPVYRNQGKVQKSYYFKVRQKFDALRLSTGSGSGYIIPVWKSIERGYNEIHFAIDFGTTNTHIEYKYGNHDAIPFDNSSAIPIWQSLLQVHDPANNPEYVADDKIFEKEIMPTILSDEAGMAHFPQRTALVFNKNMDPNIKMEPFRHSNGYMLFEKIHVPVYFDIRTQLKWGNYADVRDKALVESYIEYMVWLVYYKTLLLEGDPEKTTITWFYPVSMDGYELGVLFRTWKSVYESVFKWEATETRIHGVPESIAPYLFYKSTVIGNSLSVDIGGGSTDLAVFDEDTSGAKIISSFKFAGNAIFGDGFPTSEYRNNSDRNGFVKNFAGPAKEAVKGDPFMQPILDNILNKTKDSADFSSLLFALEAGTRNTFSYTRLLESHKRMKLPIFIFYGALAYYSSNLLKRAGMDMPRFVLLSGTASKTAAIIDPTPRFSNIAGLFRYFFEKSWQQTAVIPEVKLSSIPKEITCKGALKVGIAESITNNSIRFWIGGGGTGIWNLALDKVTDISKTPKYGDIDETAQQMIEASVLEFFAILDEYTGSVDLEGLYNIELRAWETFRRLRGENIREYLKRGIKAYYKNSEKHIEETLFFYPLIGILNKLSFELSEY
jgi:hypothetical protein